jgi:2-polyprenyl-3-methyl-5-hydroxy-6-metoxy-1,4-benzoquinol methylase
MQNNGLLSDLNGQPCVACGAPIRVRVAKWSAECPGCGTWRSSLAPAINSAELHEPIDQAGRIAGFKVLRDQNNARILDEMAAETPLRGKRLFDVGSAHGWFVEAAARRGMRAEGIEPELEMIDHARARGLTVRPGYFPAAISQEERADVISFNDVLEHIPDVDAALDACMHTLNPGGLLSVNIPSASGLAYRIATMLARVGLRGPYFRLWQHGLPSPHIHYFTPAALRRVIERHGFAVVRQRPLGSIRRQGLWARVHTVSRPTASSVVAFLALWAAAPILNRPRHADLVLLVARRHAAS